MQQQRFEMDDWVTALDTNVHGRRLLTLSKALAMAHGGASGWYVAPFAMEWTVGRAASDGERYHILRNDGEPICFCHREEAVRFVEKLLRLPENALERDAVSKALVESLASGEAWGPEVLQLYS